MNELTVFKQIILDVMKSVQNIYPVFHTDNKQETVILQSDMFRAYQVNMCYFANLGKLTTTFVKRLVQLFSNLQLQLSHEVDPWEPYAIRQSFPNKYIS